MTEARPLLDRMVEKIDYQADGCWRWTGYLDRNGYGKVFVLEAGTARLAHRMMYELLVGPIPEGFTLDHLCRNRACVNALEHLEPVTLAENSLRGEAPTVVLHRLGVCANGHDLATHAYYRRGTNRVVHCRICRNEKRRAAYAAARDH